MFYFRLSSNIKDITEKIIHYTDGSYSLLPAELRHLYNLSFEWQSLKELSDKDIEVWQLKKLLDKRIVECGCSKSIFPWRARYYFESQFPLHAKAFPFTKWLTQPPPKLVWLGLPHNNLVNLRHSTSSGLASVIDAMPLDSPIIGVLPDSTPNSHCASDIISIAQLAMHCDFKVGILGGDHRATWSFLSVLKQACNIESVFYIHIDAHHDLYGINDKKEGVQGIYHSNFLLDLLYQHNVDRVCLLGCRDNPDLINLAQKQGFDIQKVESIPPNNSSMHTHLSIDIDVLDPSYFSGVSSPLGGGWSVKKLFEVINEVVRTVRVDSISIVEAGSNCPNTIQAVSELSQLLEEII
ncbi:MAG: arginase family protein [Bacilli bacterium]